ncbi:MAG: hypothetical protein IT383_20735 [Deltaproteobacteria bacterium]|nr:hypothetical protein [Deltaproteobacteria bacterium]
MMPRPVDPSQFIAVMDAAAFRGALELIGRMILLETDPLDLDGATALGADARAWLRAHAPGAPTSGIRVGRVEGAHGPDAAPVVVLR